MASVVLPEDILMEILSRLPVKSLLRFSLVSKYWISLIQSPNFIKLHLNKSIITDKNNSFLVVRTIHLPDPTNRYKVALTPLIDETLNPVSELDFYSLSSVGSMKRHRYYHIDLYGPCNGITCLKDDEYFVLCNPATREFKTLPEPPFSYPDHTEAWNILIGFGFNVIANDYKIVRVVLPGRCDNCRHLHFHPWKVEIYSLHDDSWTEVDVDFPYSSGFSLCSNITFSNLCHWIGYEFSMGEEEGGQKMFIVTFDIGEEVFQKIILPDEEDFFTGNDSIMFLVFDGCLALIMYKLHSIICCYHLWVMREYGVLESWDKIVIGPFEGVYRPLASRNTDELFLESGDGELVSCNIRTEAIYEIGLVGMQYTLTVALFRESLTSIMGCTKPMTP